jgi:hypothetical protein
MSRRLRALLAASLAAAPLAAQEPATERLGIVHFPTSCAPAVAPQFDRAVALLHSFEFGAAIRGFEEVHRADPSCAMAWWGIALGRWTNPMVPNLRPAAVLRSGMAALDSAAPSGARATPREQGYLAAVRQLYATAERPEQRPRLIAYEQAMADLARRFPDDTEARIFHALAVVAAADPTDKSYRDQLRAGTILEGLFARYPDHPRAGALHHPRL